MDGPGRPTRSSAGELVWRSGVLMGTCGGERDVGDVERVSESSEDWLQVAA